MSYMKGTVLCAPLGPRSPSPRGWVRLPPVHPRPGFLADRFAIALAFVVFPTAALDGRVRALPLQVDTNSLPSAAQPADPMLPVCYSTHLALPDRPPQLLRVQVVYNVPVPNICCL